MCAVMTFRNWVIFAVICAAIAAYVALNSYPSLPLDSGTDPATLAAYQAAILAHWLKYAAIGLGIPLLVLIAGRLACGSKGNA